MKKYSELNKQELQELLEQLQNEYKEEQSKNLKLDMSRGKPSIKQINLSEGILKEVASNEEIFAEDGTNCANYGVINGISEARRLFSEMLEIPAEDIFVGGNSSLTLMHDFISFAFVHGLPKSEKPWKDQKVKFLCPSPGYDRHFSITEHFGFELVMVDMTPEGPNVEQIEELIKDPAVKGMWTVPKYTNPMGITFSDDNVKKLAALKPAAKDFVIMWDNSYSVHHHDYSNFDMLLNIEKEAAKHDNQDMIATFSSTSKMSYPGGGISAICLSKDNMAWFSKHTSMQTIGSDKLNQLRQARFFNSKEAVAEHMKKHAAIVKPKFDIVLESLKSIDGLGIAEWSVPKGGYFVSLDVLEGCAKKVVALCAEAGVIMTPAGATHPYGKDPHDRTIRIAPTFPTTDELGQACNLLRLCTKIASVEKYLQV